MSENIEAPALMDTGERERPPYVTCVPWRERHIARREPTLPPTQSRQSGTWGGSASGPSASLGEADLTFSMRTLGGVLMTSSSDKTMEAWCSSLSDSQRASHSPSVLSLLLATATTAQPYTLAAILEAAVATADVAAVRTTTSPLLSPAPPNFSSITRAEEGFTCIASRASMGGSGSSVMAETGMKWWAGRGGRDEHQLPSPTVLGRTRRPGWRPSCDDADSLTMPTNSEPGVQRV
mmetsp:Transcript_25956/g.51733  ORF Transcript_25956/g.51733 Transcript_25956/m.51733 type:complete len:236 (+) Transcript_25956:1494-2201(+)